MIASFKHKCHKMVLVSLSPINISLSFLKYFLISFKVFLTLVSAQSSKFIFSSTSCILCSRSSAVVSVLSLIKAENAIFSLTVNVDVIKSCYNEIEQVTTLQLFHHKHHLSHEMWHFLVPLILHILQTILLLHTWTTYPDLNLKFCCCLCPSTSTTPLPTFLPDSMSNSLQNTIRELQATQGQLINIV